MGKKKNKSSMDTTIYDHDRNVRIAENLEEYVDTIESLVIIEGRSVEELEKSIKVVKKAIKNLKNDKPEKVFDEERYLEYLSSRSDYF